MSIHKSLSLGGGLAAERSVFTRRERIERLLQKGEFADGDSVYGLPKVRTRYKVLSKKQMKAAAAAQKEKDAAEAAAAADAAAEDEEAL